MLALLEGGLAGASAVGLARGEGTIIRGKRFIELRKIRVRASLQQNKNCNLLNNQVQSTH